jgi:hypothetical protein
MRSQVAVQLSCGSAERGPPTEVPSLFDHLSPHRAVALYAVLTALSTCREQISAIFVSL